MLGQIAKQDSETLQEFEELTGCFLQKKQSSMWSELRWEAVHLVIPLYPLIRLTTPLGFKCLFPIKIPRDGFNRSGFNDEEWKDFLTISSQSSNWSTQMKISISDSQQGPAHSTDRLLLPGTTTFKIELAANPCKKCNCRCVDNRTWRARIPKARPLQCDRQTNRWRVHSELWFEKTRSQGKKEEIHTAYCGGETLRYDHSGDE